MFVGRDTELKQLNRMYAKKGFQMAVVYGRRRVGKTTLIDAFAKGKPTLYFTAQQRSSLQNLMQFSRAVHAFFDMPEDSGAFPDWRSAFSFIAAMAERRGDDPFLSCSTNFLMPPKPSPRCLLFCRLRSITSSRRRTCALFCAGATKDSWKARCWGEKARFTGVAPCN